MHKEAYHKMTQKTTLTDRERQVLKLRAEGLSYKGISEKIGIAQSTVASYLVQACNKLGAVTTADAIVTARENGLFV